MPTSNTVLALTERHGEKKGRRRGRLAHTAHQHAGNEEAKKASTISAEGWRGGELALLRLLWARSTKQLLSPTANQSALLEKVVKLNLVESLTPMLVRIISTLPTKQWNAEYPRVVSACASACSLKGQWNVQPWLSVARICPHWLQLSRPWTAVKSHYTAQCVHLHLSLRPDL